MKTLKKQKVNCPNCGCDAEKIKNFTKNITEIACPECDYLLVKYSDTGRVKEAYAPGLSSP